MNYQTPSGLRASRTGVHPRFRVLTFTAALLLSLCLGQAAARAAGLTWPTSFQSTAEITAPAGAATNPDWTTNDVACWSAGSCVAVGAYTTAGGDSTPTVIPIAAGVPGAAVPVSLPSGAYPLGSGHQNAGLVSISCQGSGDCVAVGYYSDGSRYAQPWVVPIDAGVVGTPVEVTPPGERTSSNPEAAFSMVSCLSTGNCLAAGYYTDTSGNAQAFEVPISGAGVVGTAHEITVPAGDQYDAGGFSTTGPEVSCWASGACLVAGQYLDSTNNDHEFVDDVTGGVPVTPIQTVTLPNDAHPTDAQGDQSGRINDLSCDSTGDCAAVGYYTDANEGIEGLVVPISGGQGSSGHELTLPAGAQSESSSHQYASLDAVACPAAGACVAVGAYTAVSPSGAGDAPVVAEISASGADTPFEPSVPSGSQALGNRLTSVSCPVAGSCVASGTYQTTSPVTGQGLIVPVSGGQVGPGEELPLPANGNNLAEYSVVDCSTSDSCVLAGAYDLPTSFDSEGLVDSLQVPLAVSTTSLPAGAVGSAYSQSLSATGAWGAYTWSVSSGSLPAGLSLNAQTGVISGTPTASGASTFTVKATGNGIPAQTVAQSLSITVPDPVVKVTRVGARLKASTGEVSVSLACATGACAGTVTLVYKHEVKLKHGKRKRLATVVGSGGYSLAVGASATLKVHLNAAGRRFLKLAKSHRLSVLLTASVTGGITSSRLATVTLDKVKTKKRTK